MSKAVKGNETKRRTSSVLRVLKTESATKTRGTIMRVVLNSGRKDRDGERINPQGWEVPTPLPKVLYGHDHDGFPVGKFLEPPVAKRIGLVGVVEMADATGDPDLPPIGRHVSALARGGFIDQGSVGFMPKMWTNADGTKGELSKGDHPGWPQRGRSYDVAELFEWSFVPVPSDVGSVVLSVGKSIAFEMASRAVQGKSIDRVLRALRDGDEDARSAQSRSPARPDGSEGSAAGARRDSPTDCPLCSICPLADAQTLSIVRALRAAIAAKPKTSANETLWTHLNEHATKSGGRAFAYISGDALEADFLLHTGSPFNAQPAA